MYKHQRVHTILTISPGFELDFADDYRCHTAELRVVTPVADKTVACMRVALFPGSSAWVEKKEPSAHCLRMLSSPRISGNLKFSVNLLRYTNLRN